MTRRDGTSKSNILCAVGGFAPKVGWTQMGGGTIKSIIAWVFTDTFWF